MPRQVMCKELSTPFYNTIDGCSLAFPFGKPEMKAMTALQGFKELTDSSSE